VIAVDTNVLVRLLVRDDPQQFAIATSVLEQAAENDERCYLPDAVLCETAWVLATSYGATRSDILAALTRIAAEPRYVLDDPEGLAEALRAYERGGGDFSDYLIAERATRKGARCTHTFDRKLRNRTGFTWLG
jgi:predicted nucleic-acid-binding protein